MNTTYQSTATRAQQTMTTVTAARLQGERRFCPSMFCFTDEIIVRRVSTKAAVWLLTDEDDTQSWLMMGKAPVCPHCGTRLL
jgi:hypothetical protein